MQVDEDFTEGGAWKITSSVNAVEKMIDYNTHVRSVAVPTSKDEKKEKTEKNEPLPPPKLATNTFVAPSLITIGRRTNSTSPSAFITGFWICPTGTGRVRFMSAAIGKLSIPRWMVHINLNNFLDQDTFLLVGQHRAVLKREAEGYLQKDEEGSLFDTTGVGSGGGTSLPWNNGVRKSTYVYRSPSERMPVRIGQFFDATLSRAPNRRAGVLNWYAQNAKERKLLEPWPSRERVLDRYEQHTRICPDSMDVVKRCEGTMRWSKLAGAATILAKIAALSRSSVGGATIAPSGVAGKFPAVWRSFSRFSSVVSESADRIFATILRDRTFYSLLSLAFLSHYIASRIRKEFFFKFDDELHRKDIKSIAKNWMDL